mmetsp:Transcript_26853/g.48518  ORF Transcript_26853/g.48518 Transcript_26853/m.48518 type:complete len:159 (-) Transcript_26853:98-574(-)|eukprot:CAMPEP_0197619966 /NCGR_PEP_ID=MMETSP1338-20131121/893_1 /TAXON_ID=43686 ORGANISM="Pelagodinium beii, Strain RCC1491" /NCGR_SAMPLE_ID=MMETSP1338 /ASSEMBLY_ACC=CAM_ASM_000754 /LENGTH=158 /DNA_ID=CAMNT_0043189025 /DNA_START=60 /DNA_END=536 /DNA_ORIENTATION=-
MATQQTFNYQGKEQTLWTHQQLAGMGKTSLHNRAAQIRDLVGDTMALPPLPRHQDLIADWIIEVQSVMIQKQDRAATGLSRPSSKASMASRPSSKAGGYANAAPWATDAVSDKMMRPADAADSESGSIANAESFNAAKNARQAAIEKNRSSNIFGGGA